MQTLEVLRQGASWLLLVIGCVALYAVILWPRVKGKGWLVAFLTSMVLGQLYFQGFDVVVRYSGDEPRYELYQTLGAFNFAVSLLFVAAYVFLVVALFHLRSFLHASEMPRSSATDRPMLVPSVYCLTCGYPLDHLERNDCPECGRSFDPTDSSTYARHTKGQSTLVSKGSLAFRVAAIVCIGSVLWIVLGVHIFATCFAGTHWERHPIFGYSVSEILFEGALYCAIPAFIVSGVAMCILGACRMAEKHNR